MDIKDENFWSNFIHLKIKLIILMTFDCVRIYLTKKQEKVENKGDKWKEKKIIITNTNYAAV